VKIKCFACDALIEAADADIIVDAFMAHGRSNHRWSYPEEAIRNYARNYAEATERLTGPCTTRVDSSRSWFGTMTR